MMRICPEYDPSNALIQPLMTHVDCQVESIIKSGHDGIFGQFGQFGFLLTGCLTILVAIYGLRLLMGGAQLSLKDIMPKLMLIGGLVAVVTNWSLFQLLFFGPLYTSGEGIGLAVLDMLGFSQADSIYEQLDVWIATAARLTSDSAGTVAQATQNLQQTPLDPATPQPSGDKPPVVVGANLFIGDALPKILLWGATLLAAFCSAGLMVTSKITVGLLLAIGPLLFVGILFEATRGIFMGWLQFTLRIGLLQLLTVLFTAGMMQVQLPLIQRLEFLSMSGPQSKQVLVAMLLVSLIFAAIIVLAATSTKAIAAGIKWPSAQMDAAPMSTPQGNGPIAAVQSASQQRISGMIAALESPAAITAQSTTVINRSA
ncbi:MAG: type IV secretion system protein, partial [Pseudomonadota bacterium]